MSVHVYAFGSVCRGEIDPASDIDLLACVDMSRKEFDPEKFSIYSYDRIQELWAEGNPFAWHLHLESKLVFSSDASDFLLGLGRPANYSQSSRDCEQFSQIFLESYRSLLSSSNSSVFHLSCMFLASRNFATCYSLGVGDPVFSRLSPMIIKRRLPVSSRDFDLYTRARILSTRGHGVVLSDFEIERAKIIAPSIVDWMGELLSEGAVT